MLYLEALTLDFVGSDSVEVGNVADLGVPVDVHSGVWICFNFINVGL